MGGIRRKRKGCIRDTKDDDSMGMGTNQNTIISQNAVTGFKTKNGS